MEKDNDDNDNDEGKLHVSVDLHPPLPQLLKQAMAQAGFKSRSEFVRTAIKEKTDKILQRPVFAVLPLFFFPFDQNFVFTWLAGVVVVSLLVSMFTRLVRAESAEEQARAQKVIAGGVLGGAVMFLAKPVAFWLTGIDPTAPGTTLPVALVTMVNNLLTLLQYLGGVVVVGGLIYGGIQLARRKASR